LASEDAVTRRHTLFRKLQGHIYHVTWIEGLRGIIKNGNILPNPDGNLRHSSLGSAGCYVCQKFDAISLIDLRTDRHAELFDKERPFQNWSGVFDYNDPSIALQLDLGVIQPGFVKLAREDLIKIPGRYIVEAEICHHGPIPTSAVTRAHVIGGRAWIAAYENLESAYARAVTLES
jgi:hypothetical protein